MFWSARFRDDSGWTVIPAARRTRGTAQLELTFPESSVPGEGGEGTEEEAGGCRLPFPLAAPAAPAPLAFLPRLRSLDRDVRLGAGMVAAFCIIVAATTPALRLNSEMQGRVLFVAAVLAVVDFALALFRWDRCVQLTLLAFPLLLLVGEVALALSTNGVSADYTSFFTLGFVYIGLTQSRGTGVGFALLAVPCWIISQQHWGPGLAIKLGLTVAVWLLLSGTLAVRTNRDLKSRRRLATHAYTDVLTGLGNRRAIAECVAGLIACKEPSASSLLLIDLDGFKKVNDTFGHLVGDELLVLAGRRIRTSLRDGDLAGRLGGDEFAIVLEGGIDDAKQVAARLITSLAAPITLSRIRLSVTASIGIVEIAPPSSVEDVLSHADLAMYQAKAAGRNQVTVYEEALHTRMVRRLEVEAELCDAVERDEFELHYQPIVHMGTGTIVGVEALARWRHPTRGVLPPAEFLGPCQELGIMRDLGERLLRTACHQARYWQPIDPARAISLAFNLSADEAFAPGLVECVERTLAEVALPADLLILEITEQIVMADKDRARKAMHELQALGVRIAIDDFGTGYSSLAYLREFPVNILKIDRSFVAPLGNDERALALLRSILSIAGALSLDVIVEGVETREQAEILTQLDCAVAQGFYLERPRPAAEFGTSADLWPHCASI
jgi:diguanylate cyclase (GGDEF)-like protein